MLKHGDMNDYALPFAAWELRLYLDTHPCDERALEAYKQLCAAAGDKCNYACNTDAAGGFYGSCGCEENGTARSGIARTGGSCGCDGAINRRETGNSCGCDSMNGRRGNGGSCGCDGTVSRRETGNSCGCGGVNSRRGNGESCGCAGMVSRRENGNSCGCGSVNSRRESCGSCGNDGLVSRLESDGVSGCTGERVWHWVDGPWPWELAANIIGGDC